MPYTFDWDEDKAAANLAKHGVSFDEAESAFYDALSVTVADVAHSDDEDRFILTGMSERGRLLVVSHTERGTDLRLISARLATRRERQQYEQDSL